METGKEKKEQLFEKPVKLVLLAICLVTIGLLVEAFINHNNAESQKKNIYELMNSK